MLLLSFLFVLIPWRHGRLVFETVVCIVWVNLARSGRVPWHGCRREGGKKKKKRDDGLSEEQKAQVAQELERILFEIWLQRVELERREGGGGGRQEGRGAGGNERGNEPPARNARKKNGRKRR